MFSTPGWVVILGVQLAILWSTVVARWQGVLALVPEAMSRGTCVAEKLVVMLGFAHDDNLQQLFPTIDTKMPSSILR